MIDILILAIVAVSILAGFASGLVRQAVGLAGLLIAVTLGIKFANSAGEAVASILGLAEGYAQWLGFIVVFTGVYVAALIAARIGMSMVKTLQLSGINRIAGGIFGGLKSIVFIGVLLTLLATLEFPTANMRSNSRLYEPLMQASEAAWSYVGDQLVDRFDFSDPAKSVQETP